MQTSSGLKGVSLLFWQCRDITCEQIRMDGGSEITKLRAPRAILASPRVVSCHVTPLQQPHMRKQCPVLDTEMTSSLPHLVSH